MEEIDDQLEVSDEDDTAFLVTSNSSTGGNELAPANSVDYSKQLEEHE